jgi:MFS family permease
MLRDYLRHAAAFSPAARRFLAAQALYGIGQTAVWVLRNLHLKAAGFDEGFIGSTLAVQSAAGVAVVLLATPWMDRLRLRPFQAAGIALLGGGLAGTALVRGPAALLALCFLTGLGMALLEVSASPFIVRHSTASERPYLFGVATALSPASGLLTTLAIKLGSWGWGESTSSTARMLLAAAGATAAALLPLGLLRDAPGEGGRRGEAPEPVDWPMAAKFFLPELAFGLGAGLTIPFINLYFRNRFGLSSGAIGLAYSAAQALMMGAFLLSPLIARRWGPVRTVVAFQLTSIPFFVALALTTNLAVALAAFLLRHACMNMVHPVGSHFAMEVIRPGQRARVNGAKQAANKLAWTAANSMGGVLIAQGALAPGLVDGFSSVMAVTIACYAVGSAMYWSFFRSMRTEPGRRRDAESGGEGGVPEPPPTA